MLNVLVYPWDGRCLNPSDATILSPLPLEKEIDSLIGAGKKGPDGSFQGDFYKKNHVCYPLCEQRKKKNRRGESKKKKKVEKLQTNIGITRLLPEVPRSQEVPGAAQRTGQDRSESLPIQAFLLPPPRRSCTSPNPRAVTPGRRGLQGHRDRLPGAPLRLLGSSISLKCPHTPHAERDLCQPL